MPEVPDEMKSGVEVWVIEQGYFDTDHHGDPSPDRPEGRIRRTTFPDGSTKFFHTVKRGLGLVREEREIELAESVFTDLWPQTEGRRINKSRLRVPVGDQIWEIDQFLGIDLVLAEAELPSMETELVLPAWLQARVIREVTEEPAFRNFELARSSGQIPGL